MIKNKSGFAIIELLLVAATLLLVCFIVYAALSRMDSAKNDNPKNLYTGKLSQFLTGATDDRYVNYYKLGYKLEDILVGCGATDTANVKTDTQYRGNQLQLNIYTTIQKHEKKAELTCLSIPTPFEGSIDINKNYLDKGGVLEVSINNDKHVLQVDKVHRTLKLDSSEPIPYYPDKIAVISTYPCDQDSSSALASFARANGLTLADNKFPGLSNLYRRPTKELHVLFDDKLQAADQMYKSKYTDKNGNIISPDCTPKVFKPSLQSLSQQIDP